MEFPSALKIWCNYDLPNTLRKQLAEQVQPHQLIWPSHLESSNLVASGFCPLLQEADIAFGQPLGSQVLECPRLKWVHLTSAGFTSFDNQSFKEFFIQRGAFLTNSSSVYDEPCAQHAAAFLLMAARSLIACLDNQRSDRAWPDAEIRLHSRLLKNQTILILGFGAIGRRLAEILQPFSLNIFAFKRTRTKEASVKVILGDELPDVLSQADHVINILPLNDDSRGFMNRDRLTLLKPEAVFYNIGRGQTVDQEALVELLALGTLRAAYLDVTNPEPLPPSHPLWKLPNCFITPHSAGGFDGENEALIEHFLSNLKLFASRKPLRDRIY